jgi:hypothetical protein
MGVTTGAAAPTNSVKLLAPVLEFVTQTFPEPSMAIQNGSFNPAARYPYPVDGEMAAPAGLNSLIVLPNRFAVHTLPEPSMARPTVPFNPPPVMGELELTVPVELNSEMLLERMPSLATQIFPEPSTATPKG